MSEPLRLFSLPPPTISAESASEPGRLWGYFLAQQNGHRVKHGVTDDIERRRRALQTGNSERLILAGAYPTYNVPLEQAIKQYFADLRTTGGGREWFQPWTVEFKITALGGGIPPTIFAQWASARAERVRLLRSDSAPSVQARVSELIAGGGLQELREADCCINAAMQDLVDQSAFEAMQPLQVQVGQWWQRRLSGDVPFDLEKAELRPAYIDLSQMRLGELGV